ncbi:MAG: helix-turn-helix transcriptional regulator [Myxococcales bacterium]|nr:helix-turn-helix transcriptional regulator [Myxococcales bacterium]
MSAKARYLTAAEAARILRINPKKVYVLAAQGEIPAARLGGKWLFSENILRDFLDGRTRRPRGMQLFDLLDSVIILQGSDDWLLDRAIEDLRPDLPVAAVAARVGSRAGLDALSQNRAHLACFHLPSPVSLLDARDGTVQRIELFSREQGLLLPRSRRRQVRSLHDVVRGGLRFALRQPGSGTHALTDRLLAARGLALSDLRSLGPFHSHLETALSVARGQADCGLGIRVAAELCDLEFVPLERERFWLAAPTGAMGHPHLALFLQRLLEWLLSGRKPEAPGYTFADTGKLVA